MPPERDDKPKCPEDAPAAEDDAESPAPTQAQRHDPPAEATTTGEEDRATAGQRRVNILWEVTQAFIAMLVVTTGLFVGAWLALRSVRDDGYVDAQAGAAFGFLIGAVNLVIGFYFGRTNHTRTGGVGGKDAGER